MGSVFRRLPPHANQLGQQVGARAVKGVGQRNAARGVRPDVALVLSLQRAAGNRAVAQLLAWPAAAVPGSVQIAPERCSEREPDTKARRGAPAVAQRGRRRQAAAPARTVTEPAVQRSLKFEIQTPNKVFAIENTGLADPSPTASEWRPRSPST